MIYTKEFSVIIPHRDSLSTLPKLFRSIPDRDDVEIILVDNSKTPITKNDVGIVRDYQLLYSSPSLGAGGARNVGIAQAHGKWLLFADADDFFTDDAFDIFYSMSNVEAEIVYTGMGGIYADTGEPSDRGDRYAKAVHNYVLGKLPEMGLRIGFSSPCCKMVSHELVNRRQLRFDEVVASNDVYFSLLSGYYAKSIDVVDRITYIATVSRGSLTRRRDMAVIESRFKVKLRYNKFLKAHGLSEYQGSVMIYCNQISKFGIIPLFRFILLLFQYRQNPFIGCSRWFKSYNKGKIRSEKEFNYITRQ